MPPELMIPSELQPTGVPLRAALDTFWIIVAIAIGSAIFDWIKKKRQGAETELPGEDQRRPLPRTQPPRSARTPAAPPATPQPAASTRWEEELRRLLGGEAPPAARPPPAPPPLRPVIIRTPTAPVAPPPIIIHQAPQLVPTVAKRPFIEEASEMPSADLARLDQSASAYRRASQLREAVGERLRRIDEMTERHAVGVAVAGRQPVVLSPEVAQVLHLFRNPRSARQAFVASLILGPPKALGSE